jgi:hypothetical protein
MGDGSRAEMRRHPPKVDWTASRSPLLAAPATIRNPVTGCSSA